MSNPLTALSDAIVSLYEDANAFEILGVTLLLLTGIIGSLYLLFIPKWINGPKGKRSLGRAFFDELWDLGLAAIMKLYGTGLIMILLTIIPVIIILFFLGIIFGAPFSLSSMGADFFGSVRIGIETIGGWLSGRIDQSKWPWS